ncbi:MAG TPA: hypothetical protein VMV93_00365 [Chloroflexota bacterium]|nr:hypothetical protein [Chloroflexota bacterium]
MSGLLGRTQLWAFTTFIQSMVTMDVLRTRKRLSHMTGVVARGKIRVVDEPGFAEHDFYQPGREFACRLRHSSATYDDDATLQVRGMALKFADTDYESPLDLEMNTGETPVFWTLHMFWRWTAMRLKMTRSEGPRDLTQLMAYFKEFPAALTAARDGVRRNPDSFSQLFYYSEFPTYFKTVDGGERYVKYRLVPDNRGPEAGMPDPAELVEVWDSEARLPGDDRPKDYLRREFAQRVQHEGVHYHLQYQLHTPTRVDSAEVFNASKPWEADTHPWHDLADIQLTSVLSDDEAAATRFSIGHHPPSLNLLPATSVDDYNSINYSRARMAPAKTARVLAYRFLGPAKAA